MIRLQQKVGTVMVTVEGDSLKEAIQEISPFVQLPESCPECGAEIHLCYREAGGYQFWGAECAGSPAHVTTFGQYRSGAGFYYNHEWKLATAGSVDSDRHEPDPEPDDEPPGTWEAPPARPIQPFRAPSQLNAPAQRPAGTGRPPLPEPPPVRGQSARSAPTYRNGGRPINRPV